MNAYFRASRGGYPHRPGFKTRDTAKAAAKAIEPRAMSLRARVFEAIKEKPRTPGVLDGADCFEDDNDRHACVLDYHKALEAKTDAALAAWVKRWGERVANVLWRPTY